MIDALRQALAAADWPGADGPIEPLPDSGLAHLHLRLVGQGWLARIPKQSQIGLDAPSHLAYEAACFERAQPGGHAPTLRLVLPPQPGLPRGALLVQAIDGRALQLPQDLHALVSALAALHALPLPTPDQRPPLLDPTDPLAALMHDIEAAAAHLDAARLSTRARQQIDAERQRLHQLAAQPQRPPRHLIAFDAHPGNFLVTAGGRAVLVDLEKARYGAAALDLAHATLYTSTTWDITSHAVLSDAQVLQAAQAWLQALADRGVDADAERPWIAPLRRAMWLWSVTWCAKWRVQSAQPQRSSATGEDWSTTLSDDALVAHVRERVDHYLQADTIERVCAQADVLDALLLG